MCVEQFCRLFYTFIVALRVRYREVGRKWILEKAGSELRMSLPIYR